MNECFTTVGGSILKLEMAIFNPNTIKVVHNTCSAHIAHIKVRQCPVYQPGTVLGGIRRICSNKTDYYYLRIFENFL